MSGPVTISGSSTPPMDNAEPRISKCCGIPEKKRGEECWQYGRYGVIHKKSAKYWIRTVK